MVKVIRVERKKIERACELKGQDYANSLFVIQLHHLSNEMYLFFNVNDFMVLEKQYQPVESARKRFIRRVALYLRSPVSFFLSIKSRGLMNQRASKEKRDERFLSCHGDGKNIAPCHKRSYTEKQGGFHYCRGCGCGPREQARLSSTGSTAGNPIIRDDDYTKLDYPYLECPERRAGFSNHTKIGSQPQEEMYEK